MSDNTPQLPEQVYISGVVYDVEMRDDGLFNENYYGMIDHPSQTIYVNSTVPFARQVETLLHEAIHGIDDRAFLELDERQVRVVASGLYTLFMENEEILTALFDAATS